MADHGQLIEAWKAAVATAEGTKGAASSADIALRNATNELGKALHPEGVPEEEGFYIWYGEELFRIEEISQMTYSVALAKKRER